MAYEGATTGCPRLYSGSDLDFKRSVIAVNIVESPDLRPDYLGSNIGSAGDFVLQLAIVGLAFLVGRRSRTKRRVQVCYSIPSSAFGLSLAVSSLQEDRGAPARGTSIPLVRGS